MMPSAFVYVAGAAVLLVILLPMAVRASAPDKVTVQPLHTKVVCLSFAKLLLLSSFNLAVCP